MMETSTTPTLLAALAAARAAMPVLVKNDTGYDAQDEAFKFPRENDLRDAVNLVFTENKLMEVCGNAIATAGFVQTTWSLHHLPSGESMRFDITWPLMNDTGKFSRAHAAAAAWSHAWRHFMCKLLAVKTVDEAPARPPAHVPPPVTSAKLDAEVGPMPDWSGSPPPAHPRLAETGWRTQLRVAEQRLAEQGAEHAEVKPDAQWKAAGAVLDEPAAPPPYEPPVFDVWAQVCAEMRKAGVPKRWDTILFAWHEFSGRPGDMLVPDAPEFKAWLRGQVAAWVRENANARPT